MKKSWRGGGGGDTRYAALRSPTKKGQKNHGGNKKTPCQLVCPSCPLLHSQLSAAPHLLSSEPLADKKSSNSDPAKHRVATEVPQRPSSSNQNSSGYEGELQVRKLRTRSVGFFLSKKCIETTPPQVFSRKPRSHFHGFLCNQKDWKQVTRGTDFDKGISLLCLVPENMQLT